MPRLKDLSGGKLGISTGTLNMTSDSRTVGGVAITADGTNAAVILLRKTSVSGDIILEISTTSSIFIGAPFEGADEIYYSVSGTGADCQIFEWIPYKGGRD